LSLFLITCGGGSPTEPTPPQLPTVQNIEFTTPEDTPKTFAFMGSEPQNLALTYGIATQPEHGTVSVSGGAATYTPNANYNGADTFYYLATSTSGNSNIGTVVATITPVDDEPNTMDATATTDEDNAVDITLQFEEVDGDNIQFNVVNNPSNGNVTISGTTATYTPNQDWNGTDTFNFEVVDVSSKSILNTATATITVNPINDAPEGNSIADITVDEDAPTQTISLTGISSGPNESQPVRVTATSSDSTILADPVVSLTTGSDVGTLNFTPVAMQDGDVTITVTIEDGGLDNDLSTSADNLTVTRDFDITILPTLGDYRTPAHKAVLLEQVTRLESGVKSFTFTTDTTGYYQVVTATQFATDVQMAMPVIIDALGNTVSSEATGIAAERESMTYNTLLLQPGTYQVEVGSFNGANERIKLSVSMPAVTTSADLNDRAVELTTGAVLQNELGVNGLSSGLFQQMYDVDLSTPIFHQEFDANLDDSLTSFDLKTVRFNADKSSPSVTLSMNSVASQMAAFAPAVAAVGEMGIADTFGMSIYQNPLSKNDVNGDSQVTPNDALIIINHLNSGATQRLDALQLVDSLNVAGFIDTNGDYNSSPIDVLQVINELNAITTDVVVDQGAEGEGFVAAAIHAPMLLQRADTADLHFKNLDVVDPVDVDFGFNLNEQRGSVTAKSATWSAEVDELFGDDDLDDLLEVLQN